MPKYIDCRYRERDTDTETDLIIGYPVFMAESSEPAADATPVLPTHRSWRRILQQNQDIMFKQRLQALRAKHPDLRYDVDPSRTEMKTS